MANMVSNITTINTSGSQPYLISNGYTTASNLTGLTISDKRNLVLDGGDIIMNGEGLNERIERIENMLKIPSRNVELEKKYSELADLWSQYNETLKII